MQFPKPTQSAGFTLLEMIIVITVISVFAVVIIMALGDSRAASRNAAVLAQIAEYDKALELYYSNNGVYPGPTSESARRTERCLGTASNSYNGCWNGAAGADSYLTAALVPTYMQTLPGFDQGNLGSPAYNGCTNANFNSFTSCTQDDFAIFFLLEGVNEDCGRYVQANPNYQAGFGDYTLCILNVSQ